MSDDDRWHIVDDGDEPSPLSADETPAELINRNRIRSIAMERRAAASRRTWSAALAIVGAIVFLGCVWQIATRPTFGANRIAYAAAASAGFWLMLRSGRRWWSSRTPTATNSPAADERPDFGPLSDGSDAVDRLRSLVEKQG